jgi:molecular chaperone DnaK (HSP70)
MKEYYGFSKNDRFPMTKLIERNTTIPCKKSKVFSTHVKVDRDEASHMMFQTVKTLIYKNLLI